MSEDMRKDDLSSKNTDEQRILPDEVGEQVFDEREQLHTESSPPKLQGLKQWIKTNRNKVIAAGLAVILLTSTFALGKDHRVERSQGRRHELYKQQPLERKERKKEAVRKPEVNAPDAEQNKPKAAKKQMVVRILGKEEVKQILEKELETSIEKINVKSLELIRNPEVKRYTQITPEEDQEEEKETEKTVKDKLFYKIEVELNGKKEELKIGAETGTVYYSTAKNKA